MQILLLYLLLHVFGHLEQSLHGLMSVKTLLNVKHFYLPQYICIDAIVVWRAWVISQHPLSYMILTVCMLGTTGK